jgi:hypothetical protein
MSRPPGAHHPRRVKMSKTVACPQCQKPNLDEMFTCRFCGAGLVIGKLVSRGKGLIPSGHIFALKSKDYVIGTMLAYDYVIPTKILPPPTLTISMYNDDSFVVRHDPAQFATMINDRPVVRDHILAEGDILKFGTDEFEYKQEHVVAPQEDPRILVDKYMMLLGVIQRFQQAESIEALCRLAIEVVMRFTHTSRGIFFLLDEDEDGAALLRQTASLAQDDSGLITESEAKEISQTLLSRSLLMGNAIVIDDMNESVSSESVIDLNLRSLVCVPIKLLSEGEEYDPSKCLAVIYADSNDPLLEIPLNAEPLLNMTANIFAQILNNWQVK